MEDTMRLRRVVAALALSVTGVVGLAAPVSAVTRTATTLDCVGEHPVHATASLTARQVAALKAVVQFIDSHPALFHTTCTVTP
jgi:hypothetical protein